MLHYQSGQLAGHLLMAIVESGLTIHTAMAIHEIVYLLTDIIPRLIHINLKELQSQVGPCLNGLLHCN